MKRLSAILMCLALILIIPSSRADGVSEVMCVTNCQEWVSLREEPAVSSRRLTKVYLGELVTNCYAVYDGFICCEYNGMTGYIQMKYLKTTGFSSGEAFLGNQMVVNVSEYVHLLESPSSSAKKILQVPLCSVVTACVSYMGNYVYCEYQGKKGYISQNYLADADYGVKTRNESVVNKYTGLYPDVSGSMKVANCNEWVSLRSRASASSLRLARVPLGASVDSCLQVSETFVYCCYRGVWGYIQKAYLQGNESLSAFDLLPEKPTYEQFSLAGELVTQFWSDEAYTYLVSVRRDYTETEEVLCAAVFDNQSNYICRMSQANDYISELPCMDAFPGGTPENRRLIWYTGDSVASYQIGTEIGDSLEWYLPLENGGGGLSYAVDTDGTLYLIGYYMDILSCVSPDGELMWQTAHQDPAVYWPYHIDIQDQYVNVLYEANDMTEEEGTAVSFSKADGIIISSSGNANVTGSAVAVQWAEDVSPELCHQYIFSTEDPQSRVVFSVPDGSVSDFQFFTMEDVEFGDDGQLIFVPNVRYRLDQLTSEYPLLVVITFYGDMPYYGFSYLNQEGIAERYAFDISGYDDSALDVWQLP